MKISIAIPCYEMRGRGAEMLEHSLHVLNDQSFKDFEVIVSDQSIDDKIKDVCDKYYKLMDVKHIRNENDRGSSSSNANNCILNSSGEIIKILCQDDYLFGNYSLQTIVESFDYEKGWMVGSYMHTKNRVDLFNHHIPTFSRNMILENLIGTHSCLSIINDDPLMFDKKLLWYMDSDYYYRLYKRYGLPTFLKEPTMVQYLWEGQVTNTLITQQVVIEEQIYLEEKYERVRYSTARI